MSLCSVLVKVSISFGTQQSIPKVATLPARKIVSTVINRNTRNINYLKYRTLSIELALVVLIRVQLQVPGEPGCRAVDATILSVLKVDLLFQHSRGRELGKWISA